MDTSIETAVTVRRAVAVDAAPACDVVRRSIIDLCVDDHRNDEATLATWLENKTVSLFAHLIGSRSKSCVVAVRDERVCGFGHMNDSCELGLLYVAPEARFCRGSSLMLAWLEDDADRRGFDRVFLHSSATALRFYIARNYRQSGPPIPGFGVTLMHPMVKRLADAASSREPHAIRRPVREDMSVVADVFLASRRHSLPYLPVLHSPDDVRQHFASVVFENQEMFVAERSGPKIIGFIAFDEEFVHHLYVHPDVQGIGVGSDLLTVAMQRSEHLKLWTFQRNEGVQRFYERHGFRVVTRTDGFGNEEKEPDVLMEWRS